MLSAALPLNLRYAPARSWAWVVKPQPSCCLVQNRPILEKPRYLHIISDPIWKVHVERATSFSPSTLGFPGCVVAVLNFECFKQIVVLALPLEA